jgi:hypothetical protein
MRGALVGTLLGLLLAVGGSLGSDTQTKQSSSKKPKTAAMLRLEIKELRAQERIILHAIDARYKILIGKVQDVNVKLEELRAELTKEEKLVLATIKDPLRKKAAQIEFEAMHKGLGVDSKARKATAKALRSQKADLHKYLKDVYAVQIDGLERDLLAVGGSSATKAMKK